MYIFCIVLLSALAALGVALAALEFIRTSRARSTEFICVCFDERYLSEERPPDMLIVCRTDAEQDEIIKRICGNDSRNVYIKKY
jgi:hypothetical protein